jgi:arylsulfatase A-like enzyme
MNSPDMISISGSKFRMGSDRHLDDSVAALLKHLDDIGKPKTPSSPSQPTMAGRRDDDIKATKGTVYQGGLRVLAIIRGPGKIKPGTVENGIFSGLDWLPTLAAAAGNSNIAERLLQGVALGDRTYRNHLDGYNQLDLLLGEGPSKRQRYGTSVAPAWRSPR